MKKVIGSMLAGLSLCGMAFAADSTFKDTTYGVGADVVVAKDVLGLSEVRIDGRYSIDNNETSVFAVAKVDLSGLVK